MASTQVHKEAKINLNFLVVYLGIILLFVPKINLITFEGQSAGVRIDDIIISLIAIFVVIIYVNNKAKKFSEIEILVFFFSLLSVVSNIINITLFGQSNILYSFRNLEYFVFFYIGYFSKPRVSIISLSYTYILISSVIIILQILGIVGGFRSEGYASDVSTRAVGLTGGPWEVGVMLMFSLCIILFSYNKNIYKALSALLVFVMLLLTGARLPTLSFLIVVGLWIYTLSKNKFALIGVLSISIVLFTLVLVNVDNPVTERSSNLLSYSNIEQFVEYYKNIKIDSSFVDFPEMPIDETSDMSWLFRVSKWSYAIKYWLNSYTGYIIGLGPGIWGFALDGGWIRVFTENGLIALFIYVYLLLQISSIHPALRMIVITLAVNMLMIDIHMAYKCMAFFFFIVGFFHRDGFFVYSIKTT